MEGVISNLFQLILEVSSKLAPDTINKGLKISEVLLEKVFEFRLRDQNSALVTTLVLSLSKADNAVEEDGSKWGIIHPYGA